MKPDLCVVITTNVHSSFGVSHVSGDKLSSVKQVLPREKVLWDQVINLISPMQHEHQVGKSRAGKYWAEDGDGNFCISLVFFHVGVHFKVFTEICLELFGECYGHIHFFFSVHLFIFFFIVPHKQLNDQAVQFSISTQVFVYTQLNVKTVNFKQFSLA